MDYNQLQEVCSTANRSLPTSFVDSIRLVVSSVPVVSDRPVADTVAGAIEATLETRIGPISALESRVASKNG